MPITKASSITSDVTRLKVDTKSLADSINDLFDLAINMDIAEEQRRAARVSATALRGQLITLVSQVLTGDSEEVDLLNAAIQQVNAQLKQAADDLDRIAEAIENAAALVGAISNFIGMIKLV